MSRAKDRRKKQRRKRERAGKGSVSQAFRESTLAKARNWATKVVTSETLGQPKLSDRLVRVARPFLDEADELAEAQSIINMAVIAWNSCVLPDSERRYLLDKLWKDVLPVDESDQQVGREILRRMTARKEKLFPDDRRFVAHSKVSLERDNWHVQVASTVIPSPDVDGPATEAAS